MSTTLGKRLKQLVKEKGLEQQQIAAELGINSSTFSSYIIDYREPPIDKLKKMARYFDVSVDYLICNTDRRSLYPKHLPEEILAFIDNPKNLIDIELTINIKELIIQAYKNKEED